MHSYSCYARETTRDLRSVEEESNEDAHCPQNRNSSAPPAEPATSPAPSLKKMHDVTPPSRDAHSADRKSDPQGAKTDCATVSKLKQGSHFAVILEILNDWFTERPVGVALVTLTAF